MRNHRVTTHPHYYYPDTIGDRCQHCDRAEGERPHVALPSAWIPVIATISANKASFRPNDITEYTRYSSSPLVGGNVIRALMGCGHVERIGPPAQGRAPASYRLTVRGWTWVGLAEGTIVRAVASR